MNKQQESIIIAAAEAAPFVSTGGLGESVGALANTLALCDVDVTLFLPRYKEIDLKKLGAKQLKQPLTIDMGFTKRSCAIYTTTLKNKLKLVFIEHNELFERDGLYGNQQGAYPDNCTRFALFSHAIIAAIALLKITPQLIHVHDWHCALIPLLLKTVYKDAPVTKRCKSLFTLHSTNYQGIFSADQIVWTGLGWDAFTDDNLKCNNTINFTKSALLWSDAINTMSKHYTQEISSRDNDEISEILRQKKILSINNGVDYSIYNPQTDIHISSRFKKDDLIGKSNCKSTLQRLSGLPLEGSIPLFIVNTALEHTKGMKLFADTLGPFLASNSIQCIVSGSGDYFLTQQFEYLRRIFPNKFSLIDGTIEENQHKLFAGADVYLSVSTDEPYQIETLKALAYGTIPLVSMHGSLPDLLTAYSMENRDGNAFFIDHLSEQTISNALELVRETYLSSHWPYIIENCMNFSYPHSKAVGEYLELYTQISE